MLSYDQQVSHGVPTPRSVTVTMLQNTGDKTITASSSVPASPAADQGVNAANLTTTINIPSTMLPTQQVQAVPTQGLVARQPMISQATHRPVTLSLLQGGAKLETVSMLSGKPRTVLLQTQAGKMPRILTQQALRAGLGQGKQMAGSAIRLSTGLTMTSQLVNTHPTISPAQTMQLQVPTASSTQTVAAALAKAGVLQAGGTALAKAGIVQAGGTALVKAGMVQAGGTAMAKVGVVPAGGAAKPILTRMVGGQPQVVSLSSLWASQAGLQQKATDPKQTVKIQGRKQTQ
jgi:hypothetical protein